jgi:hypothetical protein
MDFKEMVKRDLKIIGCDTFFKLLNDYPNMLIIKTLIVHRNQDLNLLLNYWKKNPPSEEHLKIINDELFKNKTDIHVKEIYKKYGPEFSDNIIYFCEELKPLILKKTFSISHDYFLQNKYHDYYLNYNKEKKINLLEKDLEKLIKKEKEIIIRKENLIKLIASKKIVKFIEEAMDDEFEMKTLVNRIAKRKFIDLMDEEK